MTILRWIGVGSESGDWIGKDSKGPVRISDTEHTLKNSMKRKLAGDRAYLLSENTGIEILWMVV